MFRSLVVALVVMVAPPDASDFTQPGFKGVLSKDTTMAVDYDAYLKLMKAARAHDTIGVVNLIKQREVFNLPEDTSVLVIQHIHKAYDEYDAFEIRLLDGRFKGFAVWTFMPPKAVNSH